MKKALVLVLLCVLMLSMGIQAIFAYNEVIVVPNQDHIVLESIGDPETVDPAWAYDTASGGVIFHVYETLIDFDRESVENYIPELATAYTVSTDGLTYTFTIREGVMFQDGSIMTVEDVEYSFERAMVQDRSGGPVWMFNEPLFGYGWPDKSGWPEDETCPINTAVEAVGNQIILHLDMAYPPFLQILCQSWASIVNKDFCIAHGDWPGTWDNWKDYEDPLTAPLDVAGNVMCGTGAYMLDYWTHGVEWSIVKFDDYWGGWPPENSALSTERITEKVVYEWGTRLADFRAGTADSVYVPRAYIAQVEGYPGIRGMKDLPGLTCGALFFNFEIATPSPYIGSGALDGNGIPPDFFGDLDVRKAFAYAWNSTKFLEEVFLNEAKKPPTPHIEGLAYATAIWSGVTNPIYGWLPPVPDYDIDLAKVEEHLKLAFGGSLGSPGPVWTNGFEMTITYNAGNVPRMTAALMFKENIESLNGEPGFGGADISTQPVTWSTYLGELWFPPTYRSCMPIYIIGWLADYPDPHNFVTPFQHSQGDFAYPSSYYNATVDAWIEAGIGETVDAEREKIYSDIGWSYYYDVPSIALYQPLGRRWEREWVCGYYYNSINPMTYYHHVWKGLDGDLDGNNEVNILDSGVVNSFWHTTKALADIWPYLQYHGDLDPTAWLPKDEYGDPLDSINYVDVYDQAAINAAWLDRVA